MSLARGYAERDLPTLREATGLCPRRRVAVQAGGCQGVFPAALAQIFDVVYTFEPDPELFRETVRAVTRHRNVVSLQVALGHDRVAVRTVRARRDGNRARVAHEGVTHVVPDPSGFVPTLRVDDLELPVCDFLCLDVEGYEFDALLGASETLARCRPTLMIEINGSGVPLGYPDQDIRNSLRLAGYSLKYRVRSDEIYVPR